MHLGSSSDGPVVCSEDFRKLFLPSSCLPILDGGGVRALASLGVALGDTLYMPRGGQELGR